MHVNSWRLSSRVRYSSRKKELRIRQLTCSLPRLKSKWIWSRRPKTLWMCFTRPCSSAKTRTTTCFTCRLSKRTKRLHRRCKTIQTLPNKSRSKVAACKKKISSRSSNSSTLKADVTGCLKKWMLSFFYWSRMVPLKTWKTTWCGLWTIKGWLKSKSWVFQLESTRLINFTTLTPRLRKSSVWCLNSRAQKDHTLLNFWISRTKS